jgi:hypothetical protein
LIICNAGITAIIMYAMEKKINIQINQCSIRD